MEFLSYYHNSIGYPAAIFFASANAIFGMMISLYSVFWRGGKSRSFIQDFGWGLIFGYTWPFSMPFGAILLTYLEGLDQTRERKERKEARDEISKILEGVETLKKTNNLPMDG